MFEKPDDKKESLINDEMTIESNGDESEKVSDDGKPQLTFLQAIKLPEIYLIGIMLGFFSIGPSSVDSYYKVFSNLLLLLIFYELKNNQFS